MKKFAVVLAGCGVYDGAEIHEAVMTMYAIQYFGSEYTLFAPDKDQHHVVNHLTGIPSTEKRNVLVESARIARGKILSLDQYNPADFDVLIFPGGFGVAKNLCSFAFDGANCKIDPGVENAILRTHRLGKPIGALCIAPVMLAKLLGQQVNLTIGNDPDTAGKIFEMGGTHIAKLQQEIVIDKEFKVVTSPCYMLDASVVDIAESAKNVVSALLDMI
jgi:enhancing lycopene biosynthesis protein 2